MGALQYKHKFCCPSHELHVQTLFCFRHSAHHRDGEIFRSWRCKPNVSKPNFSHISTLSILWALRIHGTAFHVLMYYSPGMIKPKKMNSEDAPLFIVEIPTQGLFEASRLRPPTPPTTHTHTHTHTNFWAPLTTDSCFCARGVWLMRLQCHCLGYAKSSGEKSEVHPNGSGVHILVLVPVLSFASMVL